MSEKRQYVRERCQHAVQLVWHDSAGLLHTSSGECLDISSSGLRVELQDRIEGGTVVRAKILGSLLGMATVRYCSPKKLKFIVGLEFHHTLNRPIPASLQR